MMMIKFVIFVFILDLKTIEVAYTVRIYIYILGIKYND